MSAVLARSPLIDAVKVVSAIAIVGFHVSEPGGWLRTILYSGMSVFVVLSAYFIASKNANDLARLAKRFMMPFAVWCLFYGLVEFVLVDFSISTLKVGDLFFGTWNHLWYLTFTFSAAVIYLGLVKKLDVPAGVLFAMASIAIVFQHWLISDETVNVGVAQVMSAVPAFIVGIGISSKNASKKGLGILIASLAVAIVLAIVSQTQLQQMHAIGYVIGVSVASITIALRGEGGAMVRRVAFVAPWTMGIYLVHPFLILAFNKVGVERSSAFMFVLVVVASLAASVMASSIKPIRPLFA